MFFCLKAAAQLQPNEECLTQYKWLIPKSNYKEYDLIHVKILPSNATNNSI